jgi:hypothetical protein
MIDGESRMPEPALGITGTHPGGGRFERLGCAGHAFLIQCFNFDHNNSIGSNSGL